MRMLGADNCKFIPSCLLLTHNSLFQIGDKISSRYLKYRKGTTGFWGIFQYTTLFHAVFLMVNIKRFRRCPNGHKSFCEPMTPKRHLHVSMWCETGHGQSFNSLTSTWPSIVQIMAVNYHIATIFHVFSSAGSNKFVWSLGTLTNSSIVDAITHV